MIKSVCDDCVYNETSSTLRKDCTERNDYYWKKTKTIVGALLPTTIINLIGKNVVQEHCKTGEKWKARKLLKVEITKEGVFAVLDENYNIRINLMEFDIYAE